MTGCGGDCQEAQDLCEICEPELTGNCTRFDEPTGASLGRVLSSEVSVDGKKATPGGAFPLFPYSRRRLEIPWSDDLTPEKLVLRFANFIVEERRKGAD